MGQFFLYLFRLTEPLQTTVNHKINDLVQTLKKAEFIGALDENNNITCLTAAVHLRVGSPDWGRKPLRGTEHFHQLREMNKELKSSHKVICSVFVTSDNINQTIFANHTLSIITQWNEFNILILPRFISDQDEIEWAANQLRGNQNFDMHKLFLEWYEDIFLSAQMDVFIGAHSNMVHVMASLRVTLNPHIPNHFTCFLDSRHNAQKICLGTSEMIWFWQSVVKGFNGGTIFFE